MKSVKHRMAATIFATAFGLALASGCGTEVDPPPADIGVDQEAPSPSDPPRHGSPDSIDRPSTTAPSTDNDPCVFSAEAAERLGRPACL